MISKTQAEFYLDCGTLCRAWLNSDRTKPMEEWLKTADLHSMKLKTAPAYHPFLRQGWKKWGFRACDLRTDSGISPVLSILAEYRLLEGQTEQTILKDLHDWHMVTGYALLAQILPKGEATEPAQPPESPLGDDPDLLETAVRAYLGYPPIPVDSRTGRTVTNQRVRTHEKTCDRDSDTGRGLHSLYSLYDHLERYQRDDLVHLGNQFTYRSLLLNVKYGRNGFSGAPACGTAPWLGGLTAKKNYPELAQLYFLTRLSAGEPAPWVEVSGTELGWLLPGRSNSNQILTDLVTKYGRAANGAADSDLPALPEKDQPNQRFHAHSLPATEDSNEIRFLRWEALPQGEAPGDGYEGLVPYDLLRLYDALTERLGGDRAALWQLAGAYLSGGGALPLPAEAWVPHQLPALIDSQLKKWRTSTKGPQMRLDTFLSFPRDTRSADLLEPLWDKTGGAKKVEAKYAFFYCLYRLRAGALNTLPDGDASGLEFCRQLAGTEIPMPAVDPDTDWVDFISFYRELSPRLLLEKDKRFPYSLNRKPGEKSLLTVTLEPEESHD